VDGRESRPEQGRALGERPLAQVLLAQRQQVKGDEGRGDLGREHAHPRFGGVETELEGVEVEAARTGDDDLAVDHGLLGKGCAERVEELREIALQGQAVAALQVERFALAEDDAAEAIPLGLVDETGCGGDLVRGAAEHGLEGRVECGHGSDATAEAAERLGERAQHSATGLCFETEHVLAPAGRVEEHRPRDSRSGLSR